VPKKANRTRCFRRHQNNGEVSGDQSCSRGTSGTSQSQPASQLGSLGQKQTSITSDQVERASYFAFAVSGEVSSSKGTTLELVRIGQIDMSMMKQQLETLAARMNNGDTTITDELMGLVDKYNVSCWNSRWSWTNNAGKNVTGGIGALAGFLSSGVDNLNNHPVNDIRLSIDDQVVYTHSNGG
jgi:hypothetical protein